jgi:TonB family protein
MGEGDMVFKVLAVGFLVGCLGAVSLRAQESIQRVKDLYAGAAYEDALAVLGRLGSAGSQSEAEQYRILCLVALGRTREAQKVVEAVVSSHPLYLPDPTETSPRVRELFAAARRQMLPDIARKMYLDGKAAFDRKNVQAATSTFEDLVKLIDQAGTAAGPALTEMRLLASGFLDLTKVLTDMSARPPAAAVPAEPAPVAAVVPPPRATPPVAISQTLPPWFPSDSVSRQTEFVGSVRLHILATGEVESAEVIRPVHPAYDRALLAAARTWRYQPAMQNGAAVAAEHVVEVRLRPRQ